MNEDLTECSRTITRSQPYPLDYRIGRRSQEYGIALCHCGRNILPSDLDRGVHLCGRRVLVMAARDVPGFEDHHRTHGDRRQRD